MNYKFTEDIHEFPYFVEQQHPENLIKSNYVIASDQKFLLNDEWVSPYIFYSENSWKLLLSEYIAAGLFTKIALHRLPTK